MSGAKLEVGQGGKCRVCGRVLRNEASRAAGIGPVCAGKAAAAVNRTSAPGRAAPEQRARAAFDVIRVRPDFVFIVDTSEKHNTVSVTNDADAVVAQLAAQYPGRRIIYRDTMSRWDELKHEAGRFTDFAPAAEIGAREFP